ncbi:putative sugar O-methyltransferase [Polymorphobacter fuscus]|uniref:Putative sugar O-methyltransferase n=1 Tax=Sandarakinorhabdus fusca TaxID=1439888 RepID=A0A7C9GVG4_9SPHN|nr:putative sugar O-methyltransferase [Polymorphobacter fuscus]KAB7646297.1 putative sugar O-methyltransferase [Polymorphobacter fuscus]MQT17518.1 putative sugar O-methyltransferase [Polymorphobacter fuscus]NJC09943.1 putative sugar O-methyltransferase [Polymorphobacter fuscus]
MTPQRSNPDTMRQDLGIMFAALAAGPEVYQPSKFWEQLNEQNVAQLEARGLGNFKRTLAQNYFTWVVGVRSPLFQHLAAAMTASDWRRVMWGLPMFSRESDLGLRRFYENQIFTRMVWIVAERVDRLNVMKSLQEPAFGNPFRIFFEGRLISQDLANSVIEMYAILEAHMPAPNDAFTVCEIGAGYGRNCFVFRSFFKHCKYIIADIPPALYVSQAYISEVLPDAKVMQFREFSDFSEIAADFAEADVVFLLPHQAALLPKKSVNYFVNISSFHEMNFAQVAHYFDMVDELTSGNFYLKQWTSFFNARDKMTISASDYKYKNSWHRIYDRTPSTHPSFFEALFKIN